MADSIFFFLLKGLDDSFVGETFNSVPGSYFKKTLIVYSVAFFSLFFSLLNSFNISSTAKLQIVLP